ncbi:hypothetical protein EBU71_11680 [bacterium]|nr:hypothetical protein [Candidatus Elulimicrobium humile]
MFTSNDKNEIIRLQSTESPNQQDMDSIFELYKRYINPEIQGYSTGCSCGNSITKLYQGLMGWYLMNEHQFVNP